MAKLGFVSEKLRKAVKDIEASHYRSNNLDMRDLYGPNRTRSKKTDVCEVDK